MPSAATPAASARARGRRGDVATDAARVRRGSGAAGGIPSPRRALNPKLGAGPYSALPTAVGSRSPATRTTAKKRGTYSRLMRGR